MAIDWTFLLRRGNAAEWTLVNPVLGPAEPGVELDTLLMKLGNGVDAWDDLPYLGIDATDAVIASIISTGTLTQDAIEALPVSTAVQAALDDKADAANVYTKTAADALLADKQDAATLDPTAAALVDTPGTDLEVAVAAKKRALDTIDTADDESPLRVGLDPLILTPTTDQTVTGIKTLRNGIVIDNAADADFLDMIVLKAGATTQHKRYLDWRSLDNNTDWRMGANAGNQFILYDNQGAGTHLLSANPASSGGAVQINAQGSGATAFNQEANSSNGGVHVYSGGASPTRWVALDGTGFRLFQAGTERVRFTQTGNLGIRTTDHGGGIGSIALGNAATLPSINPVAGGVMYAEAGALKWRGSSGTVTTIAPA